MRKIKMFDHKWIANRISIELSFFLPGYASVSTGSSSSSDGTGQSFTAANMNGQGQYVHTQTRPGVPPVTTAGMLPPTNNNQYYGPANIGQPGFGFNYGPAYPYGPWTGTNTPAYNPYPQQQFGFNSPFQPLQPFQPIQPQPLQPFAPFPSLASPQEFNAFLNGIQQQYIAYVSLQVVSFRQKLFVFLIFPFI